MPKFHFPEFLTQWVYSKATYFIKLSQVILMCIQVEIHCIQTEKQKKCKTATIQLFINERNTTFIDPPGLSVCLVALSCLTLCNPVHGIFHARILEWVAIFSSRGSYQPKDGTHVSYFSCIGRQILYPLSHREDNRQMLSKWKIRIPNKAHHSQLAYKEKNSRIFIFV